MKDNFLEYYRENLSHLRELGDEFARDFPKVASKLSLDPIECRDPYVERLLEGAAFLAAKVEKKLDDGFPRVIENLLSVIAPSSLTPIPAGGVLRMGSGAAVEVSGIIPTSKTFECSIQSVNTSCRISPFWNTRLTPVSIANPSLVTHLDGDLNIPEIKSALIMDLSGLPGPGDGLDEIDLYFDMTDTNSSNLLEMLIANVHGVYFQQDSQIKRLEGVSFAFTAATKSNLLINRILKVMPSVTLLQTYLAYPAFYKFVTAKGLYKALAPFAGKPGRLIVAFNSLNETLLHAVTPDCILTNCLPVLNLFPQRAERVIMDAKHEYLVSAKHNEPLNYEIFAISEMQFYDAENSEVTRAYPFFTAKSEAGLDSGQNFFALHRALRRQGIYKSRSSYRKTETFVTVSGEEFISQQDNLTQFAADTWCTNADLPMLVTTDHRFASGKSFGQLVDPFTKPLGPLVTSGNEIDYERLSFIMMNINTLAWQDPKVIRSAISRLIFINSKRNEQESRMLSQVISDITAEKRIFRIYSHGAVYFEQGIEMDLTVSKSQAAGSGIFSFGLMLVHVIADFAPMNLVIKINLCEKDRGLLYSWTNLEK
ncbi:MAG: type VI secretion system baseplate subunit TssF [Succinivibrionaceae bacterium]|nr:type VI secretion system baseplate subunit TssF [Succinivibrionaceae bacterium]